MGLRAVTRVLFCAAGLGAGAAGASESWSLSCSESTPEAYCMLFEAVLQQHYPELSVSRAEPVRLPELQLLLSEPAPNALSAQLRWRRSEADWNDGPPLDFSVMDQKMSESMITKFFVRLLAHSKVFSGSE